MHPNSALRSARSIVSALLLLTSPGIAVVAPIGAQTVNVNPPVERVTIGVGRSIPIDLPGAVTQVTITNPDIADIVVLNERSVIMNAKAVGETDIILSGAALGRRHLRVGVYTAVDRRQIAIAVKFAEVRRDALMELGVNARFDSPNGQSSAGSGLLSPGVGGSAPVASSGGIGRFLSGVTTFNTRELTAYIDAQQQRGLARSLAEPTLLAGNRDSASFLAGGELPIPIAQPGQNGQTVITLAYRPFGVQLKFFGEVVSDSLIKLYVAPEVSTLDFANALLLAGFRVPALRTRRVNTTVDVRPGQSLILSGLFNEERENVRTGVPGLMNIPILGSLFSSSRWQRAETELMVIVSPEIADPNNPLPSNRIRLLPDTARPAKEALQKRIPPG